MDNKRFDELTRGIAQGVSRREALKLFVAAIAGIGIGDIFKFNGEELTTETQTASAAVACRPTNVISFPCNQLNDYIKNCGVIAPITKTRKKNKRGYTEAQWQYPTHSTRISTGVPYPASVQRGRRLLTWCVDARATWQWTWKKPPVYTIMDYTPSDNACCATRCQKEFSEWRKAIEIHEQTHVLYMENALKKVNMHWQLKHIIGCGTSPGTALRDLRRQTRLREAETMRQFNKEFNREPPTSRGHNCNLCREAGLNEVCCSGQCVSLTTAGALSVAHQDGECSVCCDESQCQTCDPATNTCVSTCGECTTCNSDTGACEPCRACQVCENGTCVDHCGECSHCGPEGCLPDCVTGEHCCGGQCINLSQYQCCITSAGSFPCPSDMQCCPGGLCCDRTNQYCCEEGGVYSCKTYGDSSCVFGACIPCSSNQFCCLKADGSPHGCCEADYTCDPERGCIGNPTISVELPAWQGPNR